MRLLSASSVYNIQSFLCYHLIHTNFLNTTTDALVSDFFNSCDNEVVFFIYLLIITDVSLSGRQDFHTRRIMTE